MNERVNPYKISQNLLSLHIEILESCFNDRFFQVQLGDSILEVKPMVAGVYEEAFWAVFYSCCIRLATFADNTAILATHDDHSTASKNLQVAVDKFLSWWAKSWKIK